MKTLIVEDDAGTRALVRRIVQQSSKVVLEATNGLDALSVIEREDPDLVITDLRMPLLDGFELVAGLRGSASHAAIPVVCLTSVDQREEIARLLTAGITDYVLKPVKPAELSDRIRRALQTHANWRTDRNNRQRRAAGASTILLIEPDPIFRSIATSALRENYQIIEASDAADGLRRYHEASVKPHWVLVAEDLPRLSESRAAELLRQIALAADATPPQVYVSVDRDDASADARSNAIAGTIHRSFDATTFAAAVRALVGPGVSRADWLRDQVLADATAWVVAATRHAFRAVADQSIESVSSDVFEGVASECVSCVRLDIPDVGANVTVCLACSADHATALAGDAAARSPDCNGPQIVARLVSAIAAEVASGLAARGVATASPVPNSEPQVDPQKANVAIGAQTPGGRTFLLTVNLNKELNQ